MIKINSAPGISSLSHCIIAVMTWTMNWPPSAESTLLMSAGDRSTYIQHLCLPGSRSQPPSRQPLQPEQPRKSFVRSITQRKEQRVAGCFRRQVASQRWAWPMLSRCRQRLPPRFDPPCGYIWHLWLHRISHDFVCLALEVVCRCQVSKHETHSR